ncbi:MAG: UvrD-helicase domain-containing protein [Flavobacteriales bacterium]|nr:UvrD-helicase domain-containing protein [Flavobacteriales bacterium]
MQNLSTFQVYNASAGSGKTFTLVKEYLKIILKTQDAYKFKQILAITFTNKAANEMKERILNNLRAFADGDFNDMSDLLCQEISINKEVLQKRAAIALREIINNYAAFAITTIDSFTYKIIRNFSFDLGLSLNFEVALNTKTILEETVELLMSKIGIDKELTKTLLLFALYKWQKDETWDVSFALNAISKLLVDDSALTELDKIKNKKGPDYLELHEKLKKQNDTFEKEILKLGQEGLYIIKNIGIPNSSYAGGGDFPSFISKITDKNFDTITFEGRLSKSIAKDTWCSAKASEEDKQAIESQSEELKSLYFKIEELFTTQYKSYVLFNLILKNLIPLSVLSALKICLDSYKIDNNIRLNSEFNNIIRKHIKNEPVPFIYEKIGEKFSHFFIDEMQDTSTFQWENLVPLIANALHQPDSSLFLVGDAKQSIYRWRGGEAQQFISLASKINKDETVAENPFFIPKKIEVLETNFRSFSEVVNFNNAFFKNASKFLSNPTHRSLYENENSQKTTKKIGGYVQIDFLEKGLKGEDKSDAYANTIIKTLQNLKNDYTLGDVCILVRSKKDGAAIAENLTAQGINIMTSESLLMCNATKVNFIINFLSYLSQDSNKKALADALIFLHEHLKSSIQIHDFINGFLSVSKKDLFVKLKELDIDFSDNQFNEMSLYQSVAYLVRSFSLVEKSDAFIQFFLDEVLKFEQQNKGGVSHFLAYFESNKSSLSIVSPKNDNAVQILTIHKAKGLEFPVVIFPNNVTIHREIKPLEWYSPKMPSDFNDFETLLMDGGPKLEQTDTVGQQIYSRKKEALELDNINLLYVGLTRAVEQLYIVTEHSSSTAKSITYGAVFEDYLKTNALYQPANNTYTFGNVERPKSKTDKTEETTSFESKYISTDWKSHNIYIVPNASKYWNNPQQEAAIHGTLLHDILAEIKTADDIDSAINTFQKTGKITLDEALKFKNTITEMVNHPDLKKYFSPNNTVYNECEIVTKDKEILRLDRLVIKGKEAVIIDYKSGKPYPEHHQQLIGYADAVNGMNLKLTKKILVYLELPIKVIFVT